MSSPPTFDGLVVAAFESRRATEMSRLIERHGGVARVSPSLCETPLTDDAGAVDFAHRLITGEVSVAIFLTGVGFNHLLKAVERRVDRDRYLNALADITTIARGPKPVAAMREVGVQATHRAAEPNTWREILRVIDEEVPVTNQLVALQEYGKSNPSLIAGLEARGADVLNLRVYHWELPADTTGLQANATALSAGEIDVALFTSAQQLTNLLEISQHLGLVDSVRTGLQRAVVASIGPTTSEALRDERISVDVEPDRPKMGALVAAAAQWAPAIRDRKERISAMLSGPASDPTDVSAPWYNSPFMCACRREPVDVTPVWLMRQAGRYMAEYREVRAKTTFLELCKNPQLCSEVMVTAVQKLGVDAAIIFSDLLPILEPLGLDLEFAQGEGPVIHNPVRDADDVDRVKELDDVESLDFVFETVRQTRNDLPADIPLIGFAGAPFTLASYVIEGGASRNYLHTKSLMYRDEGAWKELMGKLVRAVSSYLNAQIAAGAQCVQLFDSWAGCLGPDDYRQYSMPYVRQIISSITPGVPVINFATGNPALLPHLAEAGGAVIGVDWRIRLDEAWKTIGHDRAVQGNLDPTALLGDLDSLRAKTAAVLQQAGGRAGHIFNLGHGVLQQTDVAHAQALVEMVHDLSSH
ncbi:MAG: uroporphyrinogen decarboxylase [Pirellulaceae bacterium]|jgi:uroporphyrinogen decarboxylase|nr:uroporphyrinogen decarboxylase [Pirellulaceae bacterium]MDP7019109.1 uroporphyrinogen decarboxylase [Pirellulaceae bacterium]